MSTPCRCVCCTRPISRAGSVCWSCRYGHCDLCRRLCAICSRPLTARCKTPQCYRCRNRDPCEGPRETDPPRIHELYARAMAGLPLFTARRDDR